MHLNRRITAAGLAALMSLCLLCPSGSAVSAEMGMTDRNGDGVIDVFDFILDKRDAINEREPALLAVASAEGLAGETVTVSVSLTGNKGCGSGSLILSYPEELTLAQSEDGSPDVTLYRDLFSGMNPSLVVLEDAHSILYTVGPAGESSDNGILFEVSFVLPEDAAPNTEYILSLENIVLTDAEWQDMPLLQQNGRILVVKEPEPVVVPTKRHGIDISVWQGDVDFEQLAASPDVEFVMIRAGFGRYISQIDKKFVQNYDGAKAAGLPVGAYWYSYAMTPDEARLEAQVCIEALGDRVFEYPIAFDIEEPKQLALGIDKVSAIIMAFCDEVEKAGYYVSVYCSSYYLNHTVNQEVKDRFDIWVAHYGVSQPTYQGSYGIWQYSDAGRVSGISGAVDFDYSYMDYPAIMKRAGLNGY